MNPEEPLRNGRFGASETGERSTGPGRSKDMSKKLMPDDDSGR